MVYYYLGPHEVYEPLFEPPATKEIVLPSGGVLQVEILSPDEFRVVSLWSTEPMDFLDPRYNPGSIIRPSNTMTEK